MTTLDWQRQIAPQFYYCVQHMEWKHLGYQLLMRLLKCQLHICKIWCRNKCILRRWMRMRERAGAPEIIRKIVWIFSIYNQSGINKTSGVLWWYIMEHADNSGISCHPWFFLIWRPTFAVSVNNEINNCRKSEAVLRHHFTNPKASFWSVVNINMLNSGTSQQADDGKQKPSKGKPAT